MKNCFLNAAYCAQNLLVMLSLAKEMYELVDDAIKDGTIETDVTLLLYLSRSLQNVIAHDFKNLSQTAFAEKIHEILSLSSAITLLACEANEGVCEHMESLSQSINTNATFFLGKFKIEALKGL